jgi:hypothetical protein
MARAQAQAGAIGTLEFDLGFRAFHGMFRNGRNFEKTPGGGRCPTGEVWLGHRLLFKVAW